MYQNPIITGFAADPSVCRGKDAYYLATSTFLYLPAISIFKSTDLYNWQQVANALPDVPGAEWDKYTENGGVWAPTIRYYNGTYYICAPIENKGNFIIHATDPAGLWSEPVWVDMGGIDPSLFFENDKAYFCTNDWSDGQPGVWLCEIDPVSGQKHTNPVCIYRGNGGGWLEAPHIYHIGDYYYCFAAEGGTYFGHMEIVARAENLYGPYENCPYNPILTNSHDTSKDISCAGHADLIQNKKGQYYLVHLGCRQGALSISPLGRETFLTPLQFVDGWPVVPGKKATLKNETFANEPSEKNAGIVNSADSTFVDNFTSNEWPVEWKFLRGKGRDLFQRQNEKGEKDLFSDRLTISTTTAEPSAFAYLRQPDLKFSCQAELLTDSASLELSDNDKTGLTLFLSETNYIFYGLVKKEKQICLTLFQAAGDMETTYWEEPLTKSEKINLIITGDDKKYYFDCPEMNMQDVKTRLSNRFLSPLVMDRSFIGTMIGIGILGKNGPSKASFYQITLNKK